MTASQPWLLVTEPSYFQGILGSMTKFAPGALKNLNVVVRFGLTGHGVRPNYQIEEKPDRAAAYMGSNHEQNLNAPGGRYADSDLSQEQFTLPQVQELLKRCLALKSMKTAPAPHSEIT